MTVCSWPSLFHESFAEIWGLYFALKSFWHLALMSSTAKGPLQRALSLLLLRFLTLDWISLSIPTESIDHSESWRLRQVPWSASTIQEELVKGLMWCAFDSFSCFKRLATASSGFYAAFNFTFSRQSWNNLNCRWQDDRPQWLNTQPREICIHFLKDKEGQFSLYRLKWQNKGNKRKWLLQFKKLHQSLMSSYKCTKAVDTIKLHCEWYWGTKTI